MQKNILISGAAGFLGSHLCDELIALGHEVVVADNLYTGSKSNISHLLTNPDQYLLKIGKFIRKTSLDELPNLINIIKGDMVFVGPRPALYNQDDLMALRVATGVDKLKPGITGWAQINGRDDISIEKKVQLEQEYLLRRSTLFDIEIIIKTFTNVLFSKGVSH